ncbi:MAG: helix-turn-helix domain-containing protein [Acidimicrobiia bacterium]|nr:helix-turn-helix domain-containing protein [Acidimicrobiia bacterium]
MGAVLAAYRRAVCLSRRAVATESGVESRRLKAFETGRSRIPDADLTRLAAVYEVEVEELLPPRRSVEIDMEAATLQLGDAVHAVSDPEADRSGVGESDVLRKYLELLYELRNAPRSRPLPLRDDDLSALADALGREPAVIERRLMDLMDVSLEDAVSMRRLILRRRVAMPAAGLMLGAGIISGLQATSAADANGAGGPEQGVEIGDAIVIERGDDQPTVRGGEDDDTTHDDDVEIGDAIVIERGDDEPTIRE